MGQAAEALYAYIVNAMVAYDLATQKYFIYGPLLFI